VVLSKAMATKGRFGVERTHDYYYPIEVWDYSICQAIARFKERAYAEEYVIWLKSSSAYEDAITGATKTTLSMITEEGALPPLSLSKTA